MSVNNSDYEIKIITRQEGDGAKQTADELHKVEDSAKSAGREMEKSGEKGEESHKKIQHGAEHSTLSHHELREAVGAVGREFGGLADVGLWLNPMTAGLALVLTAVEALKTGLESAQQAVEKANAALQAIDDSRLKASADAASDLATSLGEIADHAAQLNAAYAAGTSAIDARIAKYREEREAILAVQEAQERAYEAQLDAESHLNPQLKARNDALKEQARLILDAARGATSQAVLKFEIEQRQAEFNAAKNRLGTGADADAFIRAKEAEAGPAADLAEAETKKKQLEESAISVDRPGSWFRGKTYKNLEELQKAADEARENMERSQGLADKADNPQRKAYMESAVAEQKKLVDLLGEEIEKRKQALALAQAAIDKAKIAQASAKSNTEIIKSQLEKDEEIKRTSKDHIDQLQTEYDINQRRNEEVNRARYEAAQARLSAEGVRVPGTWQADRPSASDHFDPQDLEIQHHYSSVPTRERVQSDIGQGRASLEILRNRIQGGDSGESVQGQLNTLLNEFIGLAKDMHSTQQQKIDVQGIISQVRELRQRVQNLERINAQSPYNR